MKKFFQKLLVLDYDEFDCLPDGIPTAPCLNTQAWEEVGLEPPADATPLNEGGLDDDTLHACEALDIDPRLFE